jgi:plasmid replication initiation protein
VGWNAGCNRLVRKHAGRKRGGWRFDFRYLHVESASLSPFKRFAFELRDIARRQPLPGYRLSIERATGGRELLAFAPAQLSTGACEQAVEPHVLSGTNGHVPSGTGPTCYQEPEARFFSSSPIASEPPNLDSNLQESNPSVAGDRRDRWKTSGRPR